MAVGIATATAIAKEVSQDETRLDVNPSRTVVVTSEIVKDIATAVIAGASSGAYLGSRWWPLGLAPPPGP